VSSTTRWIDAPPVRISPRLHNSGRYAARGGPQKVIDRSAERAKLGQLAVQEAGEIRRSRQMLATGRRLRLSQLDELPEGAFQLFLDLLGDALAAKTGSAAAVSVTSSDGVLQIDLEPTEDGAKAVIRTTAGVLIGEDHYLTIRPVVEDGEKADESWGLEVAQSLVARG